MQSAVSSPSESINASVSWKSTWPCHTNCYANYYVALAAVKPTVVHCCPGAVGLQGKGVWEAYVLEGRIIS